MITLRPSQDRGYADHGWLQSFHSFSFAGYYDHQHMQLGNLMVLNDDRIAPGKGFGTHRHQDMEIISIVMQGQLAHEDSMGNARIIPAGDVQRMSAGQGVMHREFNHCEKTPTHFYQIWIKPDPEQLGIKPSYEQRSITLEAKRGKLCLIAAPTEQAYGTMALSIHADARVYQSTLDMQDCIRTSIDPKRQIFVHVVKGRLVVNGVAMQAGDAITLTCETQLLMNQAKESEVLVFDLTPT